jgi:hypothetical protein
MENWLLTSLIISLILTIILEEIFAVAVGIRCKRDLLLLGLVNILTNPIVVLSYFLAANYTTWNLILVTIFLESLAIIVEACYFRTYGNTFRHPFLFSICVNLFSYGIGKIISVIF